MALQLTEADIVELAQATCPHCGAGIVARRRVDTNEWCHDLVSTSHGVIRGHTICWASGIRNKYGKENENG